MSRVNETFETSAAPQSHDTSVDPLRPARRDNRLYKALAWVGIAAGSLFIVATVFFSGYVLGQHSGGGGFHHGPHRMMLKPFPGGPMGPDGPMGPRGPMGPGNGPRAEQLTPPSPQPSTPPRP